MMGEGKLNVVGLGPGHEKYILPVAIEAMENSYIIIGFKRSIESIPFISTKKIVVNSLKEVVDFAYDNKNKVVSVVASGDPCFYGIADYIGKNYDGKIEIIPGISSFQYLFAKIKKSWQGAVLGSLHGRYEDFIKIVRKEKLSFWLTDKVNTPSEVALKLLEEGIEGTMYIGENLSYEDEKITVCNIKEAVNMEFSYLSVIAIEKGDSL